MSTPEVSFYPLPHAHLYFLSDLDHPPDYYLASDLTKTLFPPPPDYESAMKMGHTEIV